ncbi:hypothetical protein LMANV2_330050 [Leptospira interrogans serovar Manilae]|uniref:Uncharacterized protein n=1 Tax=Leptospira interrogans serovar Manilae TaxID=214675 RepID=A0AAQ1P0P4_LEPIR|nr:hypothetical protein LMANV2_330050 [Leptospira interrogans serovar Manilae]
MSFHIYFFTKKLTYDKTNFLHKIHINKILYIPKKPKNTLELVPKP